MIHNEYNGMKRAKLYCILEILKDKNRVEVLSTKMLNNNA